MTKNPAVKTAQRRARRATTGGVLTLASGVKARIKPVSLSIISEAQAAVDDPEVPTWHNESKGIDEPNPNHPDYVKAVERVENERNLAAIDAMILFGVELVDGVPEDNDWLKRLRIAAKRGIGKFNADEWDLDDEIEREFIFKKYVAVTTTDTIELMKASGIAEEDIATAASSFRDNQER